MIHHQIVSVSGGKDSTATLLLALERQTPHLRAVFCDTGNEHPMTYEYIHYLEAVTGVRIEWITSSFERQIAQKRRFIEEKWANKGVPPELIQNALAILVPTGNPFLDLCLWKGRFPSRMSQFCTDELKFTPFQEQIVKPLLTAGDLVTVWMGVRNDESENRRKLKMEEDKGGGLTHFRPIIKWTAERVFEYHAERGVNPNPLYLLGMGRVGCMPCINVQKSELAEIAKRFPEQIDRIAEWEAMVSRASKRGKSTFLYADHVDYVHMTNDEIFDAANIRQMVKWARTTRGQKSINLFHGDDVPMPSCTSKYGLCE